MGARRFTLDPDALKEFRQSEALAESVGVLERDSRNLNKISDVDHFSDRAQRGC
jgi:hypothetical protein